MLLPSDPCAQINNAIKALPSTGGTVDARGFQGTQSCASNPFASITSDVELLLGDVAIQTTAPWVTPSAQRVVIIGSGRGDVSGVSHGTTIRAVSGFPSTCDGLLSGCPVIRLGGGTTTFGHRLDNLAVDCNAQSGCIGVYSTDIQEQSGLYHVLIMNFPVFGVFIDGTGSNATGPFFAENYVLFDDEVYALNVGTATTDAVHLLGSSNGPGLIDRVTASGSSGHVIQNAFYLDGIFYTNMRATNGEWATTGYLLGDTHSLNAVTGDNLQTQNVTTNCVYLKNTSSNNVWLRNIQNGANTCTNILRDDAVSLTDSEFSLGTYVMVNGNGGAPIRFSTSPNITTQLQRLAVINGLDTILSLNLSSGKTASQGVQFNFQDRGSTKFNLGLSSINNFQVFDNTSSSQRMQITANGAFSANGAGASAVQFNDQPSAGTGGVKFFSGGLSPSQVGSIDSAGNAAFNGTTTSTGNFSTSGTANAVSYKVNGTPGFSGTKTAGSCVFTISGGIITNVTGC